MTGDARGQPKRTAQALELVQQVCVLAGNRALMEETHAQLVMSDVAAAVQGHDDSALFDWLIAIFSFQGVSDAVARSYLETGGGVTEVEVTRGLARGKCPKLASFWTFDRCGYRKLSWSCSEPDHRLGCPLPRHDLRNGRLNQTAYSLRLFLRDICGGDLVDWIDRRLAEADQVDAHDRVLRLGRAVIDPFKGVFGVSDKVLSMAFSDLLIGADLDRPRWVAAGGGMIAIDTLVHNWLHRTGLLASFDASHLYGDGCYGPTGCAHLIRRLASQIDARRYNPGQPRDFPRFVQHAIWRFCAKDHADRCNGVRIDDRKACEDPDCPLGRSCARTPLFPASVRPNRRTTTGGNLERRT